MDVKQGFLYGVTERMRPGVENKYAIRALDVAEHTVIGADGAGRVVEVDRAKIDSWIPDTPLLNIMLRCDLEKRNQQWVVYKNVPVWDGETRISRNGRRAVVLSALGRAHDGRRRAEADVFYEVSVGYAVGLIVATGTHDYEVDPALARHPKVQRALQEAQS